MSQLQHIGSFQSIPADNSSRLVAIFIQLFATAKELETLASQLFSGWKPELGALIGYVPFDNEPVKGVNAEQKLVEARELEAMFFEEWPYVDALSITGDDGTTHKVAKAHVLEAFKKLKGGRTPKYGINTGNRRSVALVVANAARIVAGLPLITTVPVEIEEYENERERRIANIRSNAAIDNGRKKQDHRDMLSAAFDVLNLDGREVDLYKGPNSCQMSRNEAQRCTGIVRLNARFPELELLDRCLVESRDDFVKISQLDKEILRKLHQGKKENGVLVEEPADAEGVKAYFDNPKPDGVNADRMMSKKTIKNLLDANPNKVVQRILTAVLEDKSGPISAMKDSYKEFNALLEEMHPDTEDAPADAE